MYYVVFGLLYLLSLLPLPVLYLISDFFYLIIYYVIGYRKEVVMNNLAIAFPNKSEKEKTIIAKKFYRNFTDNFIETLKLLSCSNKFINKHFKGDFSVFNNLYEKGKKCQVHLGHNFNWELANVAVPLHIKHYFLAIYMPIENKIFDKLFNKIRTRTGSIFLPATDIRNAIIPWRSKLYTLALIADQSPAVPHNAFWVNFFGRPTPFVRGPESGAKNENMSIVFANITKIKRGYYKFNSILAEENPSVLPKGELTRKYAEYLERVISEEPEMWLWSHKRWKFEWKPEYGPIIN
jgi:KDO2-lipid IV(A) lauroyltransferase